MAVVIINSFQFAAPVPSAIVAGAGAPFVDGIYTERGLEGGKPYYNLVGKADDPASFSIYWKAGGANTWGINNEEGLIMYDNNREDVAYPWESATWAIYIGEEPPPTVTEG